MSNLLHSSAANEQQYALRVAADGVITYGVSGDYDKVRTGWIQSLFQSLQSHLRLRFQQTSYEVAEFKYDIEAVTAEQWATGSGTELIQLPGTGSFKWKSAKDTRQYGGVQDQLFLTRLVLRSLGLSYPNGDPWDPGETSQTTLMSFNDGDFGFFGHTFSPTPADYNALIQLFGHRQQDVSYLAPQIHLQTKDEELLIGLDGRVDRFVLTSKGLDPSNPQSITYDSIGPIFNDYKCASIGGFNPWEGDEIWIERSLFSPYASQDQTLQWMRETLGSFRIRLGQAFSSQEDRQLWTSDFNLIYNDAGKLLLNTNGREEGLGPSPVGINSELVAFIDVVGNPNQVLPANAFKIYDRDSTTSVQTTDISVFRLFNPTTGKHLFSSATSEIDILTGAQGWLNEGRVYTSPASGDTWLYRFYVANEGRHFYTANTSERDQILSDPRLSSFQYEGVVHQVASTNTSNSTLLPVIRYLNVQTGSHLFSTSPLEQSELSRSAFWTNEGIAWFCL